MRKCRHGAIRHNCSWQNQESQSWDYTVQEVYGSMSPISPLHIPAHMHKRIYAYDVQSLNLSCLPSYHLFRSCPCGHLHIPADGLPPSKPSHEQPHKKVQINKPSYPRPTSTLPFWLACYLTGLMPYYISECEFSQFPSHTEVLQANEPLSLPPSLTHTVPEREESSDSITLLCALTGGVWTFQIPPPTCGVCRRVGFHIACGTEIS